ncbi:MAG: cupin domain-containing protein [Myxococcales bacterium]|nr:cupin domain-containing protein [Myxococcales bacterium]
MSVRKGEVSVRERLFGGQGAVRVWDLQAGRPMIPFGAVLSCELDPGGSVGAHRQEHLPEIVIGLEGSGEATVDGVPRALDAGDVVHLPLGSVLAIRNRSDEEPLRYLIVKALDPAQLR